MGVKDLVDQFIVWGNKEPILTVRRILWLLTGGLWLGILYLFSATIMLFTIIFAPFALQVLRIAVFALDGGITKEPYTEELSPAMGSEIWSNPAHPYTIAANITWAVLIGWEMVLFHIFFAIIQAMTIVGIGTAITNIRLATYVIWPFGRKIRDKVLPTTVEQLHALKDGRPTYSQNRQENWV